MQALIRHFKLREFLFMALLLTASVPIGHMFSMNMFNASIIWPTTGFAFAFLFLKRKTVALPVFLFILIGYLIGHILFFDLTFWGVVLQSVLLTISGFVAACVGVRVALKLEVMLSLNVKDIIQAFLVGIIIASVSTLLGNLSLFALGSLDTSELWASGLVWFLGDFYGLIIFGLPLVMSLQVDKHPFFNDFNWKEGLFYLIFIVTTFLVFRGDVPHLSFVFHKYAFIPFAVIMPFFFPIRTAYMFSLLFLVLMYITEPFYLEPNIFVYMSEVNFLLIILTAIVLTLKLVLLNIKETEKVHLKRQDRLNALIDALQELFGYSKTDSLLEDQLETEASRVFRIVVKIIGNIDYGSCAVVDEHKVTFIDAIGFDKDTLNQYDISADHWVKNLEEPRRFVHEEKRFKAKSDDEDAIPEAFENDVLSRVKESVFMSVRLGDTMTVELSFDIDRASDATFDTDTLAYFEGLNILLNTFFEASKASLDPSQHTNSMVVSLLKAIDLFDSDTSKHSEHVAFIARHLARIYGLNDHASDVLYWAGIVHDIGKIGFDPSLLNKNGRLTVKEYEILKTHPERGYELLIQSSTLENIAEYVLHHHERYDGQGYPRQLKGEENLKESAILAVAEAVSAMHEERPYSPSMGQDAIIKELREEAGRQFDPEIASLACEAIKEGVLDSLKRLT